MGMVVRNNLMALNANRQLGSNTNAVQKSLEKLSSGFKINRAGDDASGLAISEKMKAQIKGLETASANSQDGISLIQTAEGALTEVHDMLNRMVELAEKSANGTIQDEVDRENIQNEVNALLSEIDRIGDSTNFNGINLIDGNLSGGASGAGALTGGTVSSFKPATTGDVAGKDMSGFVDFAEKEIIKVDGVDIEVDWSKLSADDQAALKKNWAGGSISTAEANKAAEILQNTINSAIDNANKTRGTSVAHIEVKGSQTGGNASFKITSGMEGSKDSAIEIKSTNASGVMGTMVAGYEKFSYAAPADLAAANTTATGAGLNNADPTTALTEANITAIKGAELSLDGGKLTVNLSDLELTTSDTVADAKTKIQEAVKKAIEESNKTNYANKEDYTKYSTALDDIDITAGDANTITVTLQNAEVATYTQPSTVADGAKAEYSYGFTAKGTFAADKKITIDGLEYTTVAGDTNVDGAWQSAVDAYNAQADAKYTVTYDSAGTGALKFVAKDAAAVATAPTVTTDMATANLGTATEDVAGIDAKSVSSVAEDKFNSGDVADVNGVNFDMVLGGEKFDIQVNGLDGGSNKGEDNAKALKNAIDATLDKYADAKGLNDEERQALKDNLTVEFTKDGKFNITNNSGMTLAFQDKNGGKAAELLGIGGATGSVSSGGLTLQVGDTADDFNKVTVSVDNMKTDGLGIASLNVSNQTAAGAAIKTIKSAINKVSLNRGNLGALQNRLEHTISNLDVSAENMTAANSRIRDTDMAKEMMNYTKMNVLTQAAQAMLAQANQQPQSILQLLQ